MTNALSGPLKKTSVQTFSKLSAHWNKQNRSSIAAEVIIDALVTLFITLSGMRWNSYYDAVSRVNTILSSLELATKCDVLNDLVGIELLFASQKRLVSEYVIKRLNSLLWS